MGIFRRKKKATDSAPTSPRQAEAEAEAGASEEKAVRPAGDEEEQHQVMVSYAHVDKDSMCKIRDALVAQGLVIWVDEGIAAGADWANSIGEAIVSAKVVVFCLSSASAKSRFCKDEISLAYVSDIPVVPVMLEPFDVVSASLDFGMRLTLTASQWVDLSTDEMFDKNFQSVVDAVNLLTDKGMSHVSGNRAGARSSKNPALEKGFQHFWARTWGDQEELPVKEFEEAFVKEYKEKIDEIFPEGQLPWLLGLIRREVFGLKRRDEYGVATKSNYEAFRGAVAEEVFFKQVVDLAIVDSSMASIFDADSSIRLTAVENLGRLASPRIVDALVDLLQWDDDPNVRAVAAISLSRTQRNARISDDSMRTLIEDTLMDALKDPDRLVRQAGVLALGSLRCERAIDAIAHLWRSDAISVIRDAAEQALKKMNHPAADKKLEVTRVISEEIAKLGAL